MKYHFYLSRLVPVVLQEENAGNWLSIIFPWMAHFTECVSHSSFGRQRVSRSIDVHQRFPIWPRQTLFVGLLLVNHFPQPAYFIVLDPYPIQTTEKDYDGDAYPIVPRAGKILAGFPLKRHCDQR